MRRLVGLGLFAFALQALPLAPSFAADAVPKAVAAALSDAGRPDADKARDVARKPADMVAFAGIKAGSKVVDIVPGTGYFTRIFSKVAGPKGHVYAVLPDEIVKFSAKSLAGPEAILADPAYKNVSLVRLPINDFKLPEKVDVVWISQNYHDLHDSFFGPADVAGVNKKIFGALKPGGVYVIEDHSAQAGSGNRDTEKLHRIDAEAVKTQVLAAGFVLDGSSDALRNPSDPMTAAVFDASIRGKTDQFVLRFKKPKK